MSNTPSLSSRSTRLRRTGYQALGSLAIAASMLAVTACGGDSGETTSTTTSGSGGSGGATASTGGSGGAGGATASTGGSGGTTVSTGGSGGTTATGGSGGGTGGSGAGGFDPTAGWTELTESPDTKKIYVSSSIGNDGNDGLSEAKPVKTISKGRSLLTSGKPDWLLLKRGDVWTEALGQWKKSGKSKTEPMLVSAYGDGTARPLLKTGANRGLYLASGDTVNYLAVVGLHFYAHTRDPGSPEFQGIEGGEGVRWVGTSTHLFLEDDVFDFFGGTNLNIAGATDFTVRRSVIVNSYAQPTATHSQGIYASNTKGILIEENLIDHNGWHETAQDAEPTIYNHNIYIQVDCDELVVRRNIITRASSHGLQARPGGTVEENLFVDNPSGFSYGLVLGDNAPKPGGVSGAISGNVIRDGGDIDAANPRGIGMKVTNIKSAVVEGNILAHDKTVGANHTAIDMEPNEADIQTLTVKDNIVYDWRGGIKITAAVNMSLTISGNQVQSPVREGYLFQQTTFSGKTKLMDNQWFSSSAPDAWFKLNGNVASFDQWLAKSSEQGATGTAVSYPEPDRTLGKYHGSLGKPATFTAYIAEARKQSHLDYKLEYTARGPIDYIRAGFGLGPIAP